MLDYIHFWVNNYDAEILLKNSLLYEAFDITICENTAEIKGNKSKADYRDIKFIVKDRKYIDISGSIHKYSQNGKSYQDFSFTEMSQALMNFCDTFKINPFNTIIRSFEFGVNLKITPHEIIDSVILHRTKAPDIDTYKGKGNSKEFYHEQYALRFYDKAAKDKVSDKILRYEYKVLKMEVIKSLQMHTVADLFELENWKKLKCFLTESISEMIFTEHIEEQILKKKELNFYLKGKSSDYWVKLKNLNRERFKYERKLYRKLINTKGINIQGNFLKMVSTKYDELATASPIHLSIISSFLNKYEENKFPKLTSNLQIQIPQIDLLKNQNLFPTLPLKING